MKQLTELHGGTVSVASDGDGCGTTFTVRIPALSTNAIALASSVKSLVPLRTETPRRVLLVDDNEDAVGMLGDVLVNAGHEVMIAYDGPRAITLLDEFDPAIAVIDIGMPVMNGYELALHIRQRSHSKQPYLVALTGYGQPTDRARGRAAGFDEHLVKPVDLSRLLRIIAHAHVRRVQLENAAG